MAKSNAKCSGGCPPGVDLRTCDKALKGGCPFLAAQKGGLYFRDQELFNEPEEEEDYA